MYGMCLISAGYRYTNNFKFWLLLRTYVAYKLKIRCDVSKNRIFLKYSGRFFVLANCHPFHQEQLNYSS